MRIKIELISDNVVIFPTGYNQYLQALIYKLIDNSIWLHQKGFTYEKRTFKLFCFSEILEKGKFLKDQKIFIYPQSISFYLSSPVNWILEEVAKNTILSNEITLSNNKLKVSSVAILKEDEFKENNIRVNALTPIEVHSTLHKADNSKKTYYYSPTEPEFNELINNNLKKKFQALFNKECPYNLKISPVKIEYNRERKRRFKKIIIKGWTGHFYLESDPKFLKFALDTGLGSRNSIGFGMIEMV